MWVEQVDGVDDDDSQLRFVKRALATLVRLTYRERVADDDGFPKELVKLLPPTPMPTSALVEAPPGGAAAVPAAAAASDAVMTDDASAAAAVAVPELAAVPAKMALDRVHAKASGEDLVAAMELAIPGASDAAETARARHVMEAVLVAGAGAISHTLALFDRYRGALIGLCDEPHAQDAALDAVAAVWARSTNHFCLFADALIRRHIVAPNSLALWACDPANASAYGVSGLGTSRDAHVWDALKIAIDRAVDFLAAAVIAEQQAQGEDGDAAMGSAAAEVVDAQLETAREVIADCGGALGTLRGGGEPAVVAACDSMLRALLRSFAFAQPPGDMARRSIQPAPLPPVLTPEHVGAAPPLAVTLAATEGLARI